MNTFSSSDEITTALLPEKITVLFPHCTTQEFILGTEKPNLWLTL